jgi:copper resistance protein C
MSTSRCVNWTVWSTLVSALLIATQVLAHAKLVESHPTDGETVPSITNEITIAYSMPLEVRYSVFELYGSGVDNRAPQVSRDVIELGGAISEHGGRVIRLPLTDVLKPGWYTLRWNVLAIDGHTTEGTLRFLVQD